MADVIFRLVECWVWFDTSFSNASHFAYASDGVLMHRIWLNVWVWSPTTNQRYRQFGNLKWLTNICTYGLLAITSTILQKNIERIYKEATICNVKADIEITNVIQYHCRRSKNQRPEAMFFCQLIRPIESFHLAFLFESSFRETKNIESIFAFKLLIE